MSSSDSIFSSDDSSFSKIFSDASSFEIIPSPKKVLENNSSPDEYENLLKSFKDWDVIDKKSKKSSPDNSSLGSFIVSDNASITESNPSSPSIFDDSDDDGVNKGEIIKKEVEISSVFDTSSSDSENFEDSFEEQPNESQISFQKQKLSFVESIFTTEQLPRNISDYVKDPQAIELLDKFPESTLDLVKALFVDFNEKVFDKIIPESLPINFNPRLLKTAGHCKYIRQRITHRDSSVTHKFNCSIELSPKVCTTPERLRDTLLHELCHAYVWLKHGINDGHGPNWRLIARKAMEVYPTIPVITRCHTYRIEAKFAYKCSNDLCSNNIHRNSKSARIERSRCGMCGSKFTLTRNKPKHIPKAFQTPGKKNAFASFVEENYKKIRNTAPGTPSLSHKDTMTKLSQMYKSEKDTSLVFNMPNDELF